MNKLISLLVLVAVAASSVSGFSVGSSVPVIGGVVGGSDFVVSQRRSVAHVRPTPRTTKGDLSMMGGKKAKFGIFSPAVYGAKVVLGVGELNKLRGKGISLHSSAIGDFCKWAGAYHLRVPLIKLAKTNGDILGFLV